MEFEDILKEVGDFGRFQKALLLFYGVSISLMAPFPGFSLIFMTIAPDHRCRVPDMLNLTVNELNQLNSFTNSTCQLPSYISSVDSEVYVNVSGGKCAYGYDYDKTDFDSTATTKWDLVCDNSHYPSLIMALQNVGSLVGTPAYSGLADRLGRKTMCFALMLLSSVTDLASVLVDSFFLFVVLRVINGTCLPVMFNLPYILISEFMAPERRVLVNGVFNIFWMTGMCLIPVVAYAVRSWVLLGIANAVLVASVFVYIKFVPESASWLVSQKKYKEATHIMMHIAKQNKMAVKQQDIEAKLKELGEKSKQTKDGKNENFFVFITKNHRLRKHFLILTFSWMANTISYMSLQYNVINLGGNVFLNFFLLSLVEFPGNIVFWILMEKLGRRWSATIGFLATGICCLVPVTGMEYAAIGSSIMGKLITSGMYMVTDQQGCELCPTVARSLAIGTGKSIAMSAILFAPFLAYLSAYGKSIPFIVISVFSFVGAILSLFLPETLNKNLPQSFADAENFGKDQKFFSLNRSPPSKVPPKISISTVEVDYAAYHKSIPRLLSWKTINQESC